MARRPRTAARARTPQDRRNPLNHYKLPATAPARIRRPSLRFRASHENLEQVPVVAVRLCGRGAGLRSADGLRSRESDAPAAEANEENAESGDEEKEELSPAMRRARERAKRRTEKAKKVRYAEFILDGDLPESPGGSGPFGELSLDLRKQIARIDRAAERRRDQGARACGSGVRAIGRGARHEVREAIKRFRKSGKPARRGTGGGRRDRLPSRVRVRRDRDARVGLPGASPASVPSRCSTRACSRKSA